VIVLHAFAAIAVGAGATTAIAWSLARFATFSTGHPVNPASRIEYVPMTFGVVELDTKRGPGIAQYAATYANDYPGRPSSLDRLASALVAQVRGTFKDQDARGASHGFGGRQLNPRLFETAGWPTPAFIGERTSTDDEDHVRLTLRGAAPPSRLGAIPRRPIWPGFAINTAFFAAIAWLASTVLAALWTV
jgi:hypothetical protein